MQGEGGLMSITGDPGGPGFRLGVAIADVTSGMFAAYGVAMALFARERTGRGQEVDLAMLDTVAALLTYQAGISSPAAKYPRASATVTRASSRMKRFGVGRRLRARGRQRRSMAPVLRGRGTAGRSAFATNRQR
jgi:crotonobetainyl-CoA:carnitine CoA-transferase CaiB-like acyl-CoA transferase